MLTRPSKGKPPVKSKGSKQINGSETTQNQPKPAKTAVSRIPPPQVNRIMGRYVAGQSIRAISRDEDRDRETIARIVKSMEMQEIVREQRERFFALAPKAVNALDTNLKLAEDGRLALDVLKAMGVAPRERDAVFYRDPELLVRAAELQKKLETQAAKSSDNDAANETTGTTKPPNEASGGDSTADPGQNTVPDVNARKPR